VFCREAVDDRVREIYDTENGTRYTRDGLQTGVISPWSVYTPQIWVYLTSMLILCCKGVSLLDALRCSLCLVFNGCDLLGPPLCSGPLWASLSLTHTCSGPLCPERPSLGQLGSGPLTRFWASLPRAAQHWLIQAPTRSPLCSALQGEFSCYRELTTIPG
jgi:hypothetical protein